jgi:hypothetical protein
MTSARPGLSSSASAHSLDEGANIHKTIVGGRPALARRRQSCARLPVTPTELDAVEAFLMPLVHALLADDANIQPGKIISSTAPEPIPTHKRRNELMPEEI